MLSYALAVASRVARGTIAARAGVGSVDVSQQLSQQHVSQHRAWPWECDFNQHLNNANYVRNAELARWQWLAASGRLREFYSHGMAFVVGSQRVVHLKPIAFASAYEIRTQLVGIDSGWLYVSQEFFQRDKHVASILLMAAILRGAVRTDAATFFQAPTPDAHARAQMDSLRALVRDSRRKG